MKDKEEYTDLFLQRRDYFQRNFECKVSGRRNDVERKKKFKNSCPVCGYLTLQERDSFDICTICLWEDDGYDDFNAHEESGPNHMTLIEGREIFQKAKRKLVAATEEDNKLIHA
ncbi:MAG: CPCC family cysteine-rich protein [Chitinophagales bacterium]